MRATKALERSSMGSQIVNKENGPYITHQYELDSAGVTLFNNRGTNQHDKKLQETLNFMRSMISSHTPSKAN
jgi:protein-tyrosine-phosphatase